MAESKNGSSYDEDDIDALNQKNDTPNPQDDDIDRQKDESDVYRQNWSRKMDFVLSCLSYAVGLGNVWRFPYVCYKNGGGAFLIPFVLMLVVAGIPLVFLELSFGQFASSGVVSVWRVAPIFQGVGWAMFTVSSLIAVYYNMIIAWTLYYLFASFSEKLPWSYCGVWSSENCLVNPAFMNNCTLYNGTWYNNTCFHPGQTNATIMIYVNEQAKNNPIKYISASDEYFHNVVLDISDGIEHIGGIKRRLAMCLLVAWMLACICLVKGIKSSGKAVYFTGFFPYFVLTVLLIRGLTLEGSGNGITYYLTPKWGLLLDIRVWKDAAVQTFFSLSSGLGGLITLSSYSKFNNNCLFDAVLVSTTDCLTSVYAGFVIFSIIGYMAKQLHQSVDAVASGGAGLAFVVYPAVVTKLPFSQLWSFLFFSMLATLGLGTQIAIVTTVHTTLMDEFPGFFKHRMRSFLLLIALCLVGYLIGLIFCTQGGVYVLQLFDNYSATYSLLTIGLVESIALGWVYGADNFYDDIYVMLGKYPSKIWAVFWKCITPVTLLAILILTWLDFERTTYGQYVFPVWADAVGILLTVSSIITIPIVAIWRVIVGMKNSSGEGCVTVIKQLSRPTAAWGPRLHEHRVLRRQLNERKRISETPV